MKIDGRGNSNLLLLSPSDRPSSELPFQLSLLLAKSFPSHDPVATLEMFPSLSPPSPFVSSGWIYLSLTVYEAMSISVAILNRYAYTCQLPKCTKPSAQLLLHLTTSNILRLTKSSPSRSLQSEIATHDPKILVIGFIASATKSAKTGRDQPDGVIVA